MGRKTTKKQVSSIFILFLVPVSIVVAVAKELTHVSSYSEYVDESWSLYFAQSAYSKGNLRGLKDLDDNGALDSSVGRVASNTTITKTYRQSFNGPGLKTMDDDQLTSFEERIGVYAQNCLKSSRSYGVEASCSLISQVMIPDDAGDSEGENHLVTDYAMTWYFNDTDAPLDYGYIFQKCMDVTNIFTQHRIKSDLGKLGMRVHQVGLVFPYPV